MATITFERTLFYKETTTEVIAGGSLDTTLETSTFSPMFLGEQAPADTLAHRVKFIEVYENLDESTTNLNNIARDVTIVESTDRKTTTVTNNSSVSKYYTVIYTCEEN